MESLRDHIKKYNPDIAVNKESDRPSISTKLIDEERPENERIEQFEVEMVKTKKQSHESNDSKIINISDKNHFIRKWFRTRPRYYFNPFNDSPDHIRYLFFMGICMVVCLFGFIFVMHI